MDFKHRWSAGFKQNVFNSRINTTAALAKAISNATVKPKAFVTMSGIFMALFCSLGKKVLPFTGVGIYPPDPSAEYTECSPVQQFDFFSKLTTEWEKAANLEPQAKNDCRVITIRSGVVLGKLALQIT